MPNVLLESRFWLQSPVQALASPSRGGEEGTCVGSPLLACSGFSPKKVHEHWWREKQIWENSHAIYTATLSFHSVSPSLKPFTIYALLRACIFNHFSHHLLVSLALLDCCFGITALLLEGTLLSSKAERWPLQYFGKGKWGKAIKMSPK